jgi:cytochrome b pre-mRNA-processing protein 3
MILPLFHRNRQAATIDRVYREIVAQARHPVFYRDFSVPDTVEGRLDMIMLHTVLLLHRAKRRGSAIAALAQAVFDRFCQDMDDNLREMGVGDLAVPKQMHRIAGAFYGRAKTYQEALEATDPQPLVEALRRNIYADEPESEAAARRLASYVRDAVAQLGRLEDAALAAGRLSYPEPSAAVAATIP